MNKKIVFILGGSGLIGSEVVKLFLEKKKFNVINLDIKQKNISKLKNKEQHFCKFDCDSKNLELDINKIIKKYGVPDVFINCSYPKNKDWEKSYQ